MTACAHRYLRERDACPHLAAGDGDRCIWHNRKVSKDGEYVAALIGEADAATGGDLEAFHLAGLRWPRARLGGRQLRDADLRDASLDLADLQLADLRGATLRRAGLRGADLRGANLEKADLSGANLTGADLRGANLTDACLSNVVVNGADLRGANLAGAQLGDLRWNRLTRFAGVKGLEAQPEPDSQETQAFFAPLALGENDQAATEASQLADPDPAAARTNVWTLAKGTGAAALTAKGSAKAWARGRMSPATLAAVAVAVAVAAFIGGRLMHPAVPPAPTMDAAEIAARVRAAEEHAAAAASELKTVTAENLALRDRLAEGRLDYDDATASADALRRELRETRIELERLGGIDDRAARLGDELDQARGLASGLARATTRQEEIGAILADGVARLERERDALAAAAVELTARAEEGDRASTEAARLRGVLADCVRERDNLKLASDRLSGELLATQADLERYLQRARGSGLDGLLADDAGGEELVAVVAGEPIALSGDYLVTLRVAAGDAPGTVQTRLYVQRPPALANPDIAVVLYDEQRRPLRRLSFGFPHVDAGGPFTTASATVACERFPAFARVVLAPGSERVADSR
ncbi:MAG TPA: pentapeptide repeat-containing protein [Planctomycetota bacterium]|nr:pentapeptide repeat-containing protein [Planctomycetota bacterium]